MNWEGNVRYVWSQGLGIPEGVVLICVLFRVSINGLNEEVDSMLIILYMT